MRRFIALALSASLVAAVAVPSALAQTIAKKPMTLKVWDVAAAEIAVDTTKAPVWQEIQKRTGIKLDIEIVSTQSKDVKFNLMMASQDLPDIVGYYEGKGGFGAINRFGAEGAFVPLEDLIAKYAPNLKKLILDDPAVRSSVTAADGHIYVVPMFSATKAARGWWIRGDWLKKLGLKVPTTTEELYKVAVAIRDKDPNGNGQKDEIPLIFRSRGDDAFYELSNLAFAFDADMGWVNRGGKVAYGPSEKNYKNYLAYIHRLYAEKLIDQGVLTRTGNPRDELFGKDIAGGAHDWMASTADLSDKLAKKIPGFDLVSMAPPVGIVDGKRVISKPFTRVQQDKARQDGGWSITSADKNPVETIKFFDYIVSPEGKRLTNFGIEGVHYTMVGGKPKYSDLIMKNPEGRTMFDSLVLAGCQWKIGMAQDTAYEAQFANAKGQAARDAYEANYIVPAFPVLTFTEPENEVLKDRFAQIQSYMREFTARSMVGEAPLSDFDKYVAELKRMGLDEVTRIYQAAYDRWKAKFGGK